MEKTTGYSATKSAIIAAPVPKETKSYKPVSHEELIDLVMESIDSAGFKLDKELYSSAEDGMIANGTFTISNVLDKEMQLMIGFQNSYNKKISLKFAIGTRIFICENGCVSGDYGSFKKKHTGEVKDYTPVAIKEYIKAAGDAFRKMQDERERMKEIELTKRVKAELLGRMFLEEEFIQSTQLNLIEKELKHPTHDYGAPGSLWELYQYTTFAMKNIHPSLWMRQHIKAHNFFVNEAGILVSAAPEIRVPSPGELPQLELDFNGGEQESIVNFEQTT